VPPNTTGRISQLWKLDAHTWPDDYKALSGRLIAPVQRRRRRAFEKKVGIVEETCFPASTVWLDTRRHGIAGNQLFALRRLKAEGALTVATAARRSCPSPTIMR
jgi:hypothetical protein